MIQHTERINILDDLARLFPIRGIDQARINCEKSIVKK
jgi:hypothetical protein